MNRSPRTCRCRNSRRRWRRDAIAGLSGNVFALADHVESSLIATRAGKGKLSWRWRVLHTRCCSSTRRLGHHRLRTPQKRWSSTLKFGAHRPHAGPQHVIREETQHQEGMMTNDATQIEQSARSRHHHSTIILLTHCRSGHDACIDHTVNNVQIFWASQVVLELFWYASSDRAQRRGGLLQMTFMPSKPSEPTEPKSLSRCRALWTNALSPASTRGPTVLSSGHQIGICRSQKVSHSVTNTRASEPTESEGANLANIAEYEERETLELRRELEDETCDDEKRVVCTRRDQPLGKSYPRWSSDVKFISTLGSVQEDDQPFSNLSKRKELTCREDRSARALALCCTVRLLKEDHTMSLVLSTLDTCERVASCNCPCRDSEHSFTSWHG